METEVERSKGRKVESQRQHNAELGLGGPGGMSPVDLPRRIAGALGRLNMEALRDWKVRVGNWDELHFGTGVLIRNEMRRETMGWTDVELDEMWQRVLGAAISTGV